MPQDQDLSLSIDFRADVGFDVIDGLIQVMYSHVCQSLLPEKGTQKNLGDYQYHVYPSRGGSLEMVVSFPNDRHENHHLVMDVNGYVPDDYPDFLGRWLQTINPLTKRASYGLLRRPCQPEIGPPDTRQTLVVCGPTEQDRRRMAAHAIQRH